MKLLLWLQQSEMGRVVCALRAHTTQGVSEIGILTTDLGLLYRDSVSQIRSISTTLV